jgi:hypothetical protein
VWIVDDTGFIKKGVRCSGAAYGLDPAYFQVSTAVVASAYREMPKSVRHQWPSSSRTLSGFRSRWTTSLVDKLTRARAMSNNPKAVAEPVEDNEWIRRPTVDAPCPPEPASPGGSARPST